MTFPCVNTIQHNAKKALYIIISAEIPENLVHKIDATRIKSYVHANCFVPQSQVVLDACFGPYSHTEPHL